MSIVLLVALALAGMGMGPSSADDFDLGVGAFEVGPRSALLWTRSVPTNPARKSAVVWLEVATDPGFAQRVRNQAVTVHEKHDFTARVNINGLTPSTQYH